jgi:glutamine---fructose-6-phosphate transaminase (isomerizing)
VDVCGVIAYTGRREAAPLLLDGLRRLEYRGYDSAGLATVDDGQIHLRKCAGHVASLADLLQSRPAPGCHGVGHTRWATHGGATEHNAHPHLGGRGTVAVVHNGVIENFRALRRELEAKGFTFVSDTDSEIIAHLIADLFVSDLAAAVRKAVERLQGSFALAVLSALTPGLVVGACRGSPLMLGVGPGETFLSSDPAALPESVDGVLSLEDHQLCLLRPDDWAVLDRGGMPVGCHLLGRDNDRSVCRDGDHGHRTLSEIQEQPRVIEDALRGRCDTDRGEVQFEGLSPRLLERARRLILIGCGTSYHAALLGKYLIEEFARVPAEADHASEFRYRDPPLDEGAVVVALTQSGETADTLAALAEARRQRCPTLALCNVPGSAACRIADAVVDLRAGPETGVASTKAFTAQVVALTLLAVVLGRPRGLPASRAATALHGLEALPGVVRQALNCRERTRHIAARLAGARHVFYLGRRHLYPLALEGALKFKELTYVPAQGYPAGEMKHGPIALVDEDTPSVFLMPRGSIFDKVMSNLEEVKARGGPVIAIACEGDEEVTARADEVIFVPEVPEYLQPLVTVVPLQLLAYHAAILRGCDVDKPRNLAKSVTVE